MKVLFLVFLGAFVNCADYLSIPLIRGKSAFEKMLELNMHKKHLKKIFGADSNYLRGLSATPKPFTNDSTQLFKVFQSQYYGEINVGSPGQKFKVVFSPSDDISWIPSSLCSPFVYPACAIRRKYDATRSSTYIPLNKNYTFHTDKGRLFGQFAIDRIHIGHINIYNQSFVEVEEMSWIQLFYAGYDGVLGLGFDSNPEDQIVPPMMNLFKQYPNIKPVFSFYINRDETTEKAGTLYIGYSNTKHYNGTITYLNVVDRYYWSFKIDNISVEYKLPSTNKTVVVCPSGCKGFPNTGDVFISGPKKDIKMINRILNAKYVPFLNRYEVSCSLINKLPHVNIRLNGKNFVLYGRDFVQKVTYGSVMMCLSAFTELKFANEELWGLGVSFLGRYYSEFDMGNLRIGFASMVNPV